MRDWKQYTVETLKDLDLWAKKSRGQNFLIRYRVVKQMVDAAKIIPSDHILEIGGGLGILTDALVRTGAQVTVIEKEKKLAEYLRTQYADNERVTIINDDAILAEWPAGARLIANLPYSISSPIIERIMHEDIRDAMIMLQREVALRCLAQPGSDDYSRISTICRIHSSVKRIMDLSPESFFPKPKVNSTVISIWRREPKIENDHEELELLIRNLFSLRRRIVRSVVRGFLKRTDADEAAWEACPYNQTRIFNLSIKQLDEILTHLKSHNVFPLA